ncbi:unnamed protein product, partial [Didymodactylos carnosus]
IGAKYEKRLEIENVYKNIFELFISNNMIQLKSIITTCCLPDSCQNLTILESLESLTLIYTWCYHKLLNLFQYIPNLKYLRLLFVLRIEKNYNDKQQRQHIYDKLNNKQYHHRLLLLKYLQVNYDVFYNYDSIYGHYFLSHFPCIKLIKTTIKDRYYRCPRDGFSQTISKTKTIITNYYNNQNQDLWIDKKIINIEEKPYSSVSLSFLRMTHNKKNVCE